MERFGLQGAWISCPEFLETVLRSSSILASTFSFLNPLVTKKDSHCIAQAKSKLQKTLVGRALKLSNMMPLSRIEISRPRLCNTRFSGSMMRSVSL